MANKSNVNPYSSSIPTGVSVNRNVALQSPQVIKIYWPNTSGGIRPPKKQSTGLLNKIFG